MAFLHKLTALQILTRSLSTAASCFFSPKSSAETSRDAWPWHRTDSRPTSSSPRSIPELSMVLVAVKREGGGPSGRQQIRGWGAQCRNRSTGDSPSTLRTMSPLIPVHTAPPGRPLRDYHTGKYWRGGGQKHEKPTLLPLLVRPRGTHTSCVNTHTRLNV